MTVGCSEKGEADDVICAENVPDLFDAMFRAIEDCTIDSRGDVGAWYVPQYQVHHGMMRLCCYTTMCLHHSDDVVIRTWLGEP
jgi:hypothetical protein